jgi:D-beta-D-heptose 7-phosphate kinase/D-beta-D-heptose 1-phosphate adenosyltransferase
MKTVFCNGCFSHLHSGHLFYLGFARGQGDSLIVGINSDRYIKSKKGYNPIPEDERRNEIMDLGFVKAVYVFDEANACPLINMIRPDVHCISEEYGTNCPEYVLCQALEIRVAFIPRIGKWSTRAILRGEVSYDGKSNP